MTTPAMEKLYQAQHLVDMEGREIAVFNPHNKPIGELPVIYGFNNGGSPGFLMALAMAEDGRVLGSHACSHECYMRHDLGILRDCRTDRHENDYQKHYPDGYRMEFVPTPEIATHTGFQAALERNRHGS